MRYPSTGVLGTAVLHVRMEDLICSFTAPTFILVPVVNVSLKSPEGWLTLPRRRVGERGLTGSTARPREISPSSMTAAATPSG
jgi:hypothetical protein